MILADLHLREDTPSTLQSLLALKPRLLQADAVYFLGDVFEVWLGDDAPLPPALSAVVDLLQSLHQAGVALYFQHGNRDFLLGEKFARCVGMQILPEVYVTQFAGQHLAMLHGDTLCTDDLPYQAMRRKLRHPFTRWVLRHLPLRVRHKLAQGLRAKSRQAVGDKSATIMDVNALAVDSFMQQHDVRVLIHGHTHRPAIHHLQGGRLRVVLGDWDHGASLLSLRQEGLFLQHIDHDGHARLVAQANWPTTHPTPF